MKVLVPKPKGYPNWLTWANDFIGYIEKQFRANELSNSYLPHHPSTALPKAQQAGVLIWVQDLAVVAVSDGTNWRRIHDNTTL